MNDPIEVTLHYRVYPEYGILRRSATIRNGTQHGLTLESAQSAAWNLPPGEGYQLTYLTGRWAAETQVNHEPIHEGQKVLESRKGHTSHNFNPWFAIDSRRCRRRARPRLVRRAGLERQLAHHRRADALPAGARHRRPQQLRFRLPAQAGRIARNAALLRRLLRRRLRRGLAHAAPLRARADPPGRRHFAPAPGALQLLGSHHLQRQRSRARRRSPRRPRSSASSSS